MKKFFLIIIFGLSFINVYADKCSYDQKVELSKLANEIKIDYEEKTEDIVFDEGHGTFNVTNIWLDINLYNISNRLTLKITNDYNSDMIVANSNQVKGGLYSFKDYDYSKIINYKIEIYDSGECDNILVKTKKYKKPMYNMNYNFDICKENSDVSICQKYVLSPKKYYPLGYGLEEEIKNLKNETKEEKIEEEKSKSIIYIVAGGVVTLVVIGAVWIVIHRKRSEI